MSNSFYVHACLPEHKLQPITGLWFSLEKPAALLDGDVAKLSTVESYVGQFFDLYRNVQVMTQYLALLNWPFEALRGGTFLTFVRKHPVKFPIDPCFMMSFPLIYLLKMMIGSVSQIRLKIYLLEVLHVIWLYALLRGNLSGRHFKQPTNKLDLIRFD